MKINILGAGAFGTALAIAFSPNHKIRLITLPKYFEELLSGYNCFIPDVKIPKSVEISLDIDPDCDVLFVATPAQVIEEVVSRLKKELPKHIPIIFCSKGLYVKDNKPYLMTEYAKTTLKNPLYVLGGPNFACELVEYKKSYANIAGPNAEAICDALSQSHFILEAWHDVCGIQVAGFMKNVFAIAAGYYEGQKKGLNEKAALFTHAFQEMSLVGKTFWKADFDDRTLLTYAGVGDLVLTCGSANSRNYKLGLALASGMSFDEFRKKHNLTAEGAYTAQSIYKIKGDLPLPTCDMIHNRLF
ncbi:MAG: NAD(P)-binding domain-containing protein [Alphaproteobacteria bacterium]|nr:MAG: NAD(P)-binding domain-containing protein [Alphaproteobacteria bacterium]